MPIPPVSNLKQIPPSPVRIVVADSCPLIVQGLIKIVDGDQNVELVAAATSFPELEGMITQVPSEIALIDWGLLRGNPMDAQKLMEATPSRTRVIVLIESGSMHERRFALQLGARGVVSKRSTAQQVLKAIRKVHRGGLWIERAAAEALLDQTLSPDTAEYRKGERLTNREREVALLVCRGLTNKQVSASLSISETTVWHHLTSVFGKLDVSGRVGLVNYAHKHLLAAPDRESYPLSTKRAGEWAVIETPSARLAEVPVVGRPAKAIGSRYR
jgi:DNA-binding NarL/FixJ family response regulator